ncbi:LReO_3 protein [Elysia marginata]|uniref:LReO_3 protein n=1 Tax=Elysia marginata TaxID=1093978 RepID=A0AAV4HXL8_9GAST|nr:LReO_3 protein [Elysia marginata]
MSELMKELFKLFGIQPINTSPYYPASDGMCERLNGTLKTMLRKVAEDRPKEWDPYLPAVLFAYREVRQESTGYSPFEMVYGRLPRGPIEIWKDILESSKPMDDEIPVFQYLSDLRERLSTALIIANASSDAAAAKARYYKNKNSRTRHFEVGDKTAHRQHLLYMMCTAVVDMLDTAPYSEEIPQEAKIELPTLNKTQSHKDVHINAELTDNQRKGAQKLLASFSDVLTDVPGTTNLIEHKITLTTDKVVCLKPYKLPFRSRELVEKEINEMLKLGVTEPSTSSYTSPIVLVNKPDQIVRFCIDFRRLNSITVKDAEPIPYQEELIASFGPSVWFSKLDLTKGTDASDTGLGACLLQEIDCLMHPVTYIGRKLLPREKRYAIIERECLAIVWAVGKLSCYLLGDAFYIETDSKPLLFLKE